MDKVRLPQRQRTRARDLGVTRPVRRRQRDEQTLYACTHGGHDGNDQDNEREGVDGVDQHHPQSREHRGARGAK